MFQGFEGFKVFETLKLCHLETSSKRGQLTRGVAWADGIRCAESA
jgi:hypothetical protein